LKDNNKNEKPGTHKQDRRDIVAEGIREGEFVESHPRENHREFIYESTCDNRSNQSPRNCMRRAAV
jgi:hypothetical protein